MAQKRVLVIDEESAFTRFLQDDLEQREISVACVYSPGDENGATAFAPNVILADRKMLSQSSAGLLHQLPLVLMTGTDPQWHSGSEEPLATANSQIVATIPKPFEPDTLTELIDRYATDSQKVNLDSEYIGALIASDRLLDNLVVEFQSKHALDDGRVVGYEALSRLKTRRAISPATIFSAATEISLEIEATMNVVDQVMKLAGALRRSRKRMPVSFNCSAILLTQSDFVDSLFARLQQSANLGGSVIMEITEENRVANIKVVSEICQMLNQYGLKVSIDDYGTGHSNLDRIAEIPFAELKLDKEIFWAFCNDRVPISVLGSIIDFCHMRGAKTVVEGIETSLHLEKARLLGADQGQGFYWGRAVPPQYLVKDWHGY
ncbi:EAL domain-containing response regulator [Sphingorhabdus sp. SMR4y]|uniref:EAL domain-containing response regulator n=1 Tax=Sphingorhabdus sp. SMR4y TaxID=2584094 RepID=UPI000B5CF322|nr:EAL domain-containing response regulator [Sphingorhabdus sp. SMR4y]ASK89386.1 phytochrome-like protein cph2 [Sphingorhabdus sp. SMR4y]